MYEGRQFLGGEAARLTLGLVGVGNVGREVAARGQALGFTVLGYDPAPPGAVPAGVAMVAFDELLGRSDSSRVHARATPGNRHLFGAAAFARMRRGSLLHQHRAGVAGRRGRAGQAALASGDAGRGGA